MLIISQILGIISCLLAMVILVFLKNVYHNEGKTKQMSKAAYVLLVAYLLQITSFSFLIFFKFKLHNHLSAWVLIISTFFPYVLGKMIKDFDKVNNYIHAQMAMFVLSLFFILY